MTIIAGTKLMERLGRFEVTLMRDAKAIVTGAYRGLLTVEICGIEFIVLS